jgi:hypothetical protein
VLKRNTEKVLIVLLLLLLSSCAINDCKVGYDITVEQQRTDNTVDQEQSTQDPKQKQKILEMAKDLKDNMKPGAQVSCTY